jgi:hypothetical protein
MGLTGWKRIGIVASVLWMLAGSLWLSRRILERAILAHSLAYEICSENKTFAPLTSELRDCMAEAGERWAMIIEAETGGLTPIGAGAVGALILLLSTYLLTWIVWKVVRWVHVGFQNG